MKNRVLKLCKHSIKEETWYNVAAICRHLDLAGLLTKTQSCFTYVTLSVTIKAYKSLLVECLYVNDANANILKPIAEVMYPKIMGYKILICSYIAQLALGWIQGLKMTYFNSQLYFVDSDQLTAKKRSGAR